MAASRGGRAARGVRILQRIGRRVVWSSVALLGLVGTPAGGAARPVATVTPDPGGTPTPTVDGHPGLVVAAVLAAVALVALWRVVLWLLIVTLVALGLIGLATVVAPRVARADTQVPLDAAAGSGSLPVIAVVVLVAAVFAVGLLLGEQWHRHQLARRDRQLAEARRQLTALTRGYRDRQGQD